MTFSYKVTSYIKYKFHKHNKNRFVGMITL